MYKAVFGGPYPDVVFAAAATSATVDIPIVNGVRWEPRIYFDHADLADEPEPTITPAPNEIKDEGGGVYSFRTEGMDRADIVFGEPEPEYVTREEFDAFKRYHNLSGPEE